jgi:hypothetical protein
MDVIPFDEIAPGATVRTAVIDELYHLSIRDLLMHLNESSSNSARKKWNRLPDEQKNELTAFCKPFQFPGRGNRKELVITFEGALKLALMVSGEKAAQYRAAMVNILKRYFRGDESLIDDIEANAVSTSLVSEMARNALAAEGVVENSKKRAKTSEALSVETFRNEVSIMLRDMEMEMTEQLRGIAAGQGEVVAMCTQVDAKQDNIYQKLYELSTELNAEKERNAYNTKCLSDLRNELKELSAELKARQMQIERQTAAIAHLNNTIRAKDALLVKAEDANQSIHQKLDTALCAHQSIHRKLDMLLTRNHT